MGHGQHLNTLRPRRNEQHFADDIFKLIFFNENVWISIKISLKFVPKGPINNIPALVQIMAWRRPGNKPLSEPMMVRSTTHICVTGPQWINLNMDMDGSNDQVILQDLDASTDTVLMQGSFCICTQPMRDGVTFVMSSLIGWAHTLHKMIPAYGEIRTVFFQISLAINNFVFFFFFAK